MNLKQLVGIKAAEFVEDGMIVGLGTGSTAYYMVEEIGRRMREEGLKITGVTTSSGTKAQAESLGIPLKSIDEVPVVDLTIDGADEISADFQGIKGGGAALLFEKIVASYSKQTIWIVDGSKMVDQLGRFPLPVEVIPYGSQQLMRLFKEKNYQPVLRQTETGETVVTDSGHYIIDLHLERIEDPEKLATYLDQLVGVVEHGLFLNMVSKVVVASENGVSVLDTPFQK
ncbi:MULTISPECIES: ribose-5-phosphate isomerase RpiA [Enterococcus]|uniref:Ribose-5-phosphate isomerase A n=1 Tax=Enterococcus mundtii TaxID=53346 RepID=A0A1A6G6T3_ENTMU|nr:MULTISPECIES: ribose-5-phosphate isomerase RpiA [Enterococcus]MBE6172102.1 ribose-5-phosphate isomerase RpiA [Enterococcus faecium]EOH64656.1 ribose-5-phosphate isomerase A [Enterococcus mundtii ATCC 882]EOU14222.1 ribose-5-phosphate isomerase A [Enterococcus mundtii ATCC 882]MBE9911736.1 ribose-5-phosphate isomerase RpiA [Enterococcus mundtii]MCA6773452.1 ribose-5-phosphate isomerase RpiA [Enterococcus mundtii]